MEECEMQDCDLAFEYSDVKARIKGTVESVKTAQRVYTCRTDWQNYY